MNWRDDVQSGYRDALWPTRLTLSLWPVCVLWGVWSEPRLPLVWTLPASALLVLWQARNLVRFPWRRLVGAGRTRR